MKESVPWTFFVLFSVCNCSGLRRLEHEISGEDFLYNFFSKNHSFVIANVTKKWQIYSKIKSNDLFTDPILSKKSLSVTISNNLNAEEARFEQITNDAKMHFNYEITNEDQHLQKLIGLPAVLLTCQVLYQEFREHGRVYLVGSKKYSSKIRTVDSCHHNLIGILRGAINMSSSEAEVNLIPGDLAYIPAHHKTTLKLSENILFLNFTLPSIKRYHTAHCGGRPPLYVMTSDVTADETLKRMYVDHMIGDRTLNTGFRIPPIGLGTGRLFEKTYEINTIALGVGYKLIDTAHTYSGERNRESFMTSSEEEIGRALSDSGVERKELFIVTKVDPNSMTYEGTISKIMTSLKNLGIDYLDAVLVHDFSTDNYCDNEDENCELNPWICWRALEELQSRGLVRSIGASNIDAKNLEFLVKNFATSMVSIVQNWFDPLHQDAEVRRVCKEHSIAYMGYSTLGAMWSGEDGLGYDVNPVLNHVTIVDAASSNVIPVPTFVLRWAMENDVIVIPCSRDPVHLEFNIAARNISIEPNYLGLIEKLDNLLGNPDDETWEKSNFDDLFEENVRIRANKRNNNTPKDEL